MNMLPPAIGILSAVLKKAGHDVSLFDTTYYESLDGDDRDSDASKSDRLMARPYKMPNEVTCKKSNCFDDFRNEVREYMPDLIALSTTEDMFRLGIKLLDQVDDLDILTVVGGVFATFAPDLILKYSQIDIICRGEGEDAMKILCDRIGERLPFDDISNLCLRNSDGTVKKNQMKMVNFDNNPLIDLSLFEEARFYRPMSGKVYKMFPVETNRGCPYQCTYCNSPSQVKLHKAECGQMFIRKKSAEKIREELLFYKDEMKAEYLYFWSDTFFVWTGDEFEKFAQMYKEINLPFWCQTRIETITYDNMKKLKDIGCARLSFGIEHGNEKFRKEVLGRKISNDLIVKNLKIVNEVGIPFSVNNMMGFPHETPELAFDTIRLNKLIDSADRNAYPYSPFHGTPLRDECEKLGFVGPDDIATSFVVSGSILDMPQFPKKKVDSLAKVFNLYVKFPEDRWEEIEKAEEDTPEGRKIYEELKQEFIKKFF